MSAQLKPTSDSSTWYLLSGIWLHLSKRRRFQFVFLLMVMLFSGASELLSLGSVLPFLAVISDTDRAWKYPIVQLFAGKFGLTDSSQLLLPATLSFALAALMSALIRLFNLWLNGQFAARVGSDLSCEAYRRTLYQNYIVHLQRNSAAVITSITTEISRTVRALTSFLQMLTSAVVALSLFIGLLLIDWKVALGTIALFSAIYSLLAITAKRDLQRNSQRIAVFAKLQIKALQEGLGAIRDVLLKGTQSTYVMVYRQADLPQRQLLAKNQFLAAFPRYAVESLAMVAIAFLAALLVFQQGSGGVVIPLLGALALGAQRLLPALQQVYSGWAVLKGANASISAVLSMLNQELPQILAPVKSLPLKYNICFEDVHFSYSSDQVSILDGVNFEIMRGERIGLVGMTGAGKSTILDLLMGLIAPTRGKILIDGMDLHDPDHPERLAEWRSAIEHVPQNIYLADSSFSENIAFGIETQRIDISKVQQAAKSAMIADYIESTPNSYNTFVGERGVRLSGGQCQRLGIARALYDQAQLLVLDEATSALDTATEESVMASLDSLSKDTTIIMIAHRLTTLEKCDRILELKDGKVLLQSSDNQIKLTDYNYLQ
ncbi:ABC transporter ATP-binding protein [Synechococcus sp. KORDI-49]|uniref:ABC transporter ATP-binding protein n=1 Tax=Synechococcus sp. KORDI-49 TaxID=585423 RepID=UPI0005BDEE41|nr:ABC transporter ATP-binding protein [Synechococcus sp. KORDI-49]